MSVIKEAKRVLAKNLRTGTRQVAGEEYEYLYICPAFPKYPHQWLWDSAFHVIVTSAFDPTLAKREVASLLKGMRPNGFMPNKILWEGPHTWIDRYLDSRLLLRGMTSNITQPPVIAIALEEIYKNTGDLGFIRRYLPLVKRYLTWLETERDPDGDGLVSIIHPWEGLDASPSFSSLLEIKKARPRLLRVYGAFYRLLLRYSRLRWDTKAIFADGSFNVGYVMFNCIYAQGLRATARLSKATGNEKEFDLYDLKADRVERAILDICWNQEEGIFFDVSSPDHRQLSVKTISSLFPIILDSIPRDVLERLINGHLLNEEEFWLPFPVPSVAKDEPTFNPGDSRLLWRGPTWINTNWFLVGGLKKHGYDKIARQIARKSIELVERGGFWEFFNPFTGEGGGQKDYSWSTLVVDMLDYR